MLLYKWRKEGTVQWKTNFKSLKDEGQNKIHDGATFYIDWHRLSLHQLSKNNQPFANRHKDIKQISLREENFV